jgi:hypothetical protein
MIPTNSVPSLNHKSKLYFISKFTKEIIGVWQECPSEPSHPGFLEEASRENETMNHMVMRHVLRKLGFLKEFTEDTANTCRVRDMAQLEQSMI